MRYIYGFTSKNKAIVIIMLIIMLPFSISAETDVQMLTEYFDLLISGNIESAQYLWFGECQERASRFNIEYDNILLKNDCSSPIVSNMIVMRNYLQPPVKKVKKLPPGNYSELIYSAIVNGTLVTHKYHTQKNSNYNWLIYPQDYYARTWLTKDSKYFRIKYHPDVENYLHPVVLAEADNFVERIADSLGLSKTQVKYIEEKKIEYFYCNNDKTVDTITGFLVKGIFDLPSNDIISAFFPHYHEITHLLINYYLHKLPIYTIPLFREGIAVYYGGRWGKTPSSLIALGGFLYQEDFVTIDSILTVSGFENHAGTDIAYPVAGLFTAYLLDQIGQKNYFTLYRELSGSLEKLKQMPDSAIAAIIIKATGDSSWENLITKFDNYINKSLQKHVDMLPGKLQHSRSILSSDNFDIVENNDWVAVEFTSINNEPPAGNILFGFDSRLADIRSTLFERQYRNDIPFEGYRYGIRFDSNEAGVYDYATNILLAKYIWGITPSDEYYIETEKKIFIKFKKNIVNTALPTESDYKLLPN